MSETPATNGHYKPKDNHPWRRYANRITPLTKEEIEAQEKLPSLKIFLTQIVENWETYSIPSGDFEDGISKIKSMGDARAAEWLVSFVRRTWIGNKASGKSFFLDL
jgi:hypothetical protein